MIAATSFDEDRRALMADEHLADMLMEDLSRHIKLTELDRYASLLAPVHSPEALEIYQRVLVPLAEGARNRKAYSDMIWALKSMQKYQGGQILARSYAADWIRAYPTRKLMVQELREFLDM